MSRPSTIWQRGKSGWWYTTINGKQMRLAQDKAEAQKALHALLAHDKEPEVRGRPTFRSIADAFLERSHEVNTPETFNGHRRYLQSFCDHVKNRRAPDIRGEHVTSWIKANPQWGPSTRSLAIQVVKAAMNYAVEQGRISVHPIKAVRQGQMKSRQRIVSEAEWEKIWNRATGTFRDFLFALKKTGMRPYSEAAKITAAMVDFEEGVIRFEEHKNAKHGKKREVICTPELLEILKRLAKKHPAGLLFRNRYGDPWTKEAGRKWRVIFEKELGIKGVNLYALRHTWISDAIARGVPLPVIAELVGNSVQIIIRNYCHLQDKKDELRAAMIKATGP